MDFSETINAIIKENKELKVENERLKNTLEKIESQLSEFRVEIKTVTGKKKSITAQIKDQIRKYEAMSATTLGYELPANISNGTIRAILSRLHKDGVLVKVERGFYKFAEAQNETLQRL